MTRESGWIPVDLSPDPELGTIRKHFSGTARDRVVYAEILKGDDLDSARADGERLWIRHSEICTARKPFNPRPAHVRLDLPNRT
nr:hypothetical protein [Rhodococcus sp. 15-1154-1]